MDAMEKTKSVERLFLKTDALIPNEMNPNEMTDAEFNMLADNMEKTGMTDPILVRPVGEGKFRIIGGHHRWEIAKVMGFIEVPCTVITDPEFDEDQERFQVVRMNVIRGHLSPEKLMKMYEQMSSKYADAVMAEAFGFVDEAEFRKLVFQVKKSLPKDMQKDFQKASEELKTIDDLSKLLNSMFTKYGDTLPYGYMLLDFGGKESVWLRMSTQTKKAVLDIGIMCKTEKRTVDDIIGGVVRLLAKGEFSAQVLQLIAASKEVEIPENIDLPTEEALNA